MMALASSAPRAFLLMGPTASGKSAVALELAQSLPIEIVSVDSAQVYRGMDIGTAKPNAATRSRVAHHLIDIIEPREAYSAARFRTDALAAIAAIHARGRIALLVGGTMLYFKALREGLSSLPPADAAIRARLDARATVEGWPALHAELARVDPPTSSRLKPNDSQRIQRALEVYEISGKPLSALQGARERAPTPDFTALALMPADRGELHRRIEARFDAMLARGLVEEVEALRRSDLLDAELPAMRCVGYRQVWEYLDGSCDYAAMRRRAIAATRQLAKRQLTWMRRADATLFDSEAPGVAASVRAGIVRNLA